MKRKKSKKREYIDIPNQDEYFYYIAGFTSGGAPYGVTWEDMGISTDLSIEERLKVLEEREEANHSKEIDFLEDDLPF